jgi:hypothetical protein
VWDRQAASKLHLSLAKLRDDLFGLVSFLRQAASPFVVTRSSISGVSEEFVHRPKSEQATNNRCLSLRVTAMLRKPSQLSCPEHFPSETEGREERFAGLREQSGMEKLDVYSLLPNAALLLAIRCELSSLAQIGGAAVANLRGDVHGNSGGDISDTVDILDCPCRGGSQPVAIANINSSSLFFRYVLGEHK